MSPGLGALCGPRGVLGCQEWSVKANEREMGRGVNGGAWGLTSGMSACIFSHMGNELLLRGWASTPNATLTPHSTCHKYTPKQDAAGEGGSWIYLVRCPCCVVSSPRQQSDSRREKRNSQPLLKRKVESCGLSPSFLVARWRRRGALRPLWQDYSASP